MQKQYGITVREALSLDTVNRLTIVGGKSGLDRVIKLVNVIEVPDIKDWLIDGEFLLTTGYSFREYPELLETLIPRMSETHSAALAIKTKRYLDEIPIEMINSANKYNIPLLEVPFDLSFSEIIAPILGVVFNKQYKILQKLEQAHKKLMDLALNGSPLEELCKETGKLISNPVAIVDREGILIVNDDCPDMYKFEQFFSDGSIEIKKEKLRFGNIKEVKYSLEYASENNKPLTIKAIRIPIIADKYEYGHMVAIINNPIYEPDILTIERAATIAALEFTKRKAIFEIEKSYYSDFLEILLSSDFENVDEIMHRGRVFNIDLAMPTAVIIINDNSLNEIADIRQHMNINGPRSKEDLLKAINSYLRLQDGGNLIAGIKGNNIVIVTGTDLSKPSGSLKDTVSALVNYLCESTGDTIQIKVGVGKAYPDIRMISRSYEEAREALKIAQLSEQAHVVFFDNLGFYKILSEKNRGDLERFVEELLQPVFDYDRQKKGDLIKTLETYFDTNRNLKLTSTRLFTHYNTVLYSIKKIEELTSISLDNPENALNLEIAINILKLFRNSSV
ncbi:MAG: PucR family transcriptional regulator ligand-binding domain-containing protein [Dethiobacteria bacterium]|nr:PucR family transcriptional regulator ligand-binding domain-containing protein [Dethiobacteria bacterium]